ncbi:Hypothetical protein R9X50_00170400 [Acrodontium crateriforme]|uniref:Uncharacterized protein n=1 Tax=Acrodontium crateriforme TaxID=150365 RepID=A0AAQ3R8F0_9PEZI|nr:Hypothetical protein R9X50_00170400 [Acrodontium crateriforme]
MTKIVAALAALAATAAAQSALVTVEAFNCGAGSCITNTTIEVPLGSVYTNSSALDKVSFLYLTGATGGIATGSITCTPYKDTSGSGSAGLPFNSTTPSLLSTNLVQLGSIVCKSIEPIGVPGSASISSASATGSGSSSSPSITFHIPIPTSSTTGNYSTSLIKTLPPSGGSTISESQTSSSAQATSSMHSESITVITITPTISGQHLSTVTSVVIASGTEPATTSQSSGVSSSTSASPSLNTSNAASVGSKIAYGGLAAALLGFAFAL